MKNIKQTAPYLLINLLAFYLLPPFIKDSSGAMLLLLVVFPIATMACSLAGASKFGFSWIYPIAIAACFLPCVFIFYNSSAWGYSLVYGFLALIGNFIGWTFKISTQSKTRTLKK
ncbi:MAG: hypothetical protein RSD35_04410 [Oscillospiraceae bacterium]